MKTTKATILLSLAAATAALSLTACNTFSSRAREKSETYESLPPTTQQRLKKGQISPGDTQDMVYIGLGNPDEKREITTNDGVQETWIYRTYWEQYEGTEWVGWHRVIIPTGRGYAIYHEPVTQDVYRSHVDEVIRVTFNRGVVASVEQRRR